MKNVYTGRDELDATFVKGLLADEGIIAVVHGAALQETWGNLNLTQESLPSVWVEDPDVVRAEPIIEEYRRREQSDAAREDKKTGDLPPRPTWTCAHCGEKVEEQFTQCWHCGHPKPATN